MEMVVSPLVDFT